MSGPPAFSALEWAVLQTVAYADIFDYPLTTTEIQRYLIGHTATTDDLQPVLQTLSQHAITQTNGYYTLTGREHTITTRCERLPNAQHLWPLAYRYGQLIGQLPFVRMVAVTGSLAVDNIPLDGDIDYLIVTEPGRLWLTRLFIVALVRWVERQGVTLCPNYIISENVLLFEEQSLFAARELAQMVPVSGLATYNELREANGWMDDYLPNAHHAPPEHHFDVADHANHPRALEFLLRTPPAAWFDRWEMQRKIRKFADENGIEAAFNADACKGHFDGHMQRIMHAYHQRLSTIEHRYTRSNAV